MTEWADTEIDRYFQECITSFASGTAPTIDIELSRVANIILSNHYKEIIDKGEWEQDHYQVKRY